MLSFTKVFKTQKIDYPLPVAAVLCNDNTNTQAIDNPKIRVPDELRSGSEENRGRGRAFKRLQLCLF